MHAAEIRPKEPSARVLAIVLQLAYQNLSGYWRHRHSGSTIETACPARTNSMCRARASPAAGRCASLAAALATVVWSPSASAEPVGRIDNDEALEGALPALSNWDRWGEDDQLGTLNFIIPQTRLAAAALIRTGRVVPIGREFSRQHSRVARLHLHDAMLRRPLTGGGRQLRHRRRDLSRLRGHACRRAVSYLHPGRQTRYL